MTEVPGFRRYRPLRRALPFLVAALLVATIGLPSVAALGPIPVAPFVGHARPLAGPVALSVNLTDRPGYSPQFLSLPAGSNVSIHLDNVGNYTHTFTLVSKPDISLSPTLDPAGVYAFFRTNGSLANVSLAPGAEGWANLSFNASLGLSSFEFVSVVPYQFQAGMYGYLNLTSVGPGLLLSDNTTNSLSFVPNVLAAAPTHYPVNVDVLVTNLGGSFPHTFTLAPQTNVSLSPANFTQYFAQHPPLVRASVPIGAGSSVWANFTVAAPGVYEYICEVPGHFASGMFGFLYVGVTPTPPPPPPSTAVVESWVLAGSLGLLGIGVVLAVVASFSGRFPRAPGSHGGQSH